jgi:hypothetical protein
VKCLGYVRRNDEPPCVELLNNNVINVVGLYFFSQHFVVDVVKEKSYLESQPLFSAF